MYIYIYIHIYIYVLKKEHIFTKVYEGFRLFYKSFTVNIFVLTFSQTNI